MTDHLTKAAPALLKAAKEAKEEIEFWANEAGGDYCQCDPGDSETGVPQAICAYHQLSRAIELAETGEVL